MREMTKDAFWDLIAEAKKACGQDTDGSIQWLQDRLTSLGPRQAQDFHDILHGYQDLADQYGLWSAASILCEHSCSDDGFIDFRSWLIAQGKETYLTALADPDSLAEVESYDGCQFEALTYVGSMALEAMTGRSAYDGTDPAAYKALLDELRADIAYGEGIGYPYEWDEVAARFPRICAKYLKPGEVESRLANRQTMWYPGHPDIQKAREGGPPEINTPQIDMKMEGF